MATPERQNIPRASGIPAAAEGGRRRWGMQPCGSSPPVTGVAPPGRSLDSLTSPFISSPFPSPPATDPRLRSALAPAPRAATPGPRAARRVYFRRHRDPRACEKQAARARPARLRGALSLGEAFPAKQRELWGCSEPAARLPSPARCPYGEEGLPRGEGGGSPPPAWPLPIKTRTPLADVPCCRLSGHPRSRTTALGINARA